jgi:hypothetical protein
MFIWDDMFFVKENEVWISKVWAMRGPTGSMMNKVVPEPYQSQIEKAYRECMKGAGTLRGRKSLGLIDEDKGSRIKGLRPPKNDKAAQPKVSTKPKKTLKKKLKRGLSISGLEDLIKKEAKVPSTVRRKKGSVVGGIKLSGSKK